MIRIKDRGSNIRSNSHDNRNLRLFLCAMVVGTLLASAASAQVVEGYIQLPDSLGVFPAPYKVAWDFTPGAERLFIGGDSSDILVIDAVDFQKLKRIATGRVGPLCFSPAHNKLYAASWGVSSLYVIDCSTYQISKQVQLGGGATGLFYNPIVDRVYCSTSPMKVLDCSSDSVVGTISGVGAGPTTFDSTHNKLYVGASTTPKVVDCYADSLVATIDRVRGTTAICYNSFCSRVYAAAGETTYAIDVVTDTVVGQSVLMHQILHTLCCDAARNRVYAASSLSVVAWDCGADTMLWGRSLALYPEDGPKGLACVPDLDRVYVVLPLCVSSFEGSTGGLVGTVAVDARAAPPVYLNRLNRLYLLANRGQLAAIDCGPDTTVGQALLDAFVDDSPERVCLDTADNKLYFLLGGYCGCLGVADCSAKQVVSYHMLSYPTSMVHDALDDKLYVSTWMDRDGSRKGVSVFDCKSDTLVKVIPAVGAPGWHRWHPGLNKVYASAGDSLGYNYVVVIDCATDSVVRTLARGRQDDWFRYSLLSTELDQYWGFSGGYTVVDCENDSIVIDTLMDSWSAERVCYSETDRKVYVAHGSEELVVLSMESLRPTRRIQLTTAGHAVDAMIHVAGAGKTYVAVMASTSDSVYAVDTRSDSIVSKFDAGHIIRAMCDDATGRYVYCTALVLDSFAVARETLLVIDTQCDSIVSGVSLPGVTWGAGEWLLPNRRTGRIYAGQDPNGKLLVIRDSVAIGVGEWSSEACTPVILRTVVNRAVPLRSTKQADVYDASGRRAAVLRSGPNDISHLAPGVYFLRGPKTEDGRLDAAVRKVVVTR